MAFASANDVGASYSNPQPYTLSQVVRLLANDQPDPAFASSPGGNGTVNAMGVQANGRVLVGGIVHDVQ